MKTPLILAILGLLLAGGSAADQTVTKGREPSVAADASRQAQESLLKAQLAAWQKIRAADWSEAQRKKKEFDEYVRTHPRGSPIDLIPTRVVDHSAAEAQQARGRVEIADRFIDDVQQRLTRLGPAARRQGSLTPPEGAVATLAEKEAERALLAAQQSTWQPVRAYEWEMERRNKREYEEYVRQHPDDPTNHRSGAEANLAAGRVETLDRFLDEITHRLTALESEIKVARAALAGVDVKVDGIEAVKESDVMELYSRFSIEGTAMKSIKRDTCSLELYPYQTIVKFKGQYFSAEYTRDKLKVHIEGTFNTNKTFIETLNVSCAEDKQNNNGYSREAKQWSFSAKGIPQTVGWNDPRQNMYPRYKVDTSVARPKSFELIKTDYLGILYEKYNDNNGQDAVKESRTDNFQADMAAVDILLEFRPKK